MDPTEKHSFPPSVFPGAKVLILGSMPGDESLRQQEYYAYKHNVFWKIMSELFHFPQTLPYSERLAALGRNRIALWDSLASCRRAGSLDTKIIAPVPNDIAGLLRDYPAITHIFCNGTASFQFLKRYNAGLFQSDLQIQKLPSTSPAAAVYSFEAKLKAYSIIRDLLCELQPDEMTSNHKKQRIRECQPSFSERTATSLNSRQNNN